MCFHSQQSKDAQEIEHRYQAKMDDTATYLPQGHINGFAHPYTPVITHTTPATIQHFQWGLIPNWSKDDTVKKYTLNAKIETIGEKPSFRGSVNNRCLVIADGFFEWKWLDAKGKQKQKYLITLPDKSLFAFGGIWSAWRDGNTGTVVHSYSIVTTEANQLMSEIHNTKKRMPVILTEANEKQWLAGDPLHHFQTMEVELIASVVQ